MRLWSAGLRLVFSVLGLGFGLVLGAGFLILLLLIFLMVGLVHKQTSVMGRRALILRQSSAAEVVWPAAGRSMRPDRKKLPPEREPACQKVVKPLF